MEILTNKAIRSLNSIYYDTSILYKIFSHHYISSGKIEGQIEKRCEKISKTSVGAFISILCIDELLHNLLFGKQGYITNEALTYWTKTKGRKETDFSLKRFKRKYSKVFCTYVEKYSIIYEYINSLLEKYKINVVYPTPSLFASSDINKIVKNFAETLHNAFPLLDIKDTFHLSIAFWSGIRNFYTFDNDFQDVIIPEFSIYSEKRS